jgi:hypothetical protein
LSASDTFSRTMTNFPRAFQGRSGIAIDRWQLPLAHCFQA